VSVSTRLRALVAASALAAALPLALSAPAAAQSGQDVVEQCDPLTQVPEAGTRVCGGVERGLWLGAQHCRRIPGLAEPVCPTVDGRPVHETAMAEFERGWTHRALTLQSALDDEVPLTDAMILHTHNSANSAAYDPSVTSNDANQVLSVRDQLRMGIRGIELDVHWAPHPQGDPAHGFRAPVQCHGQSEPTPAGNVHAGCSVDQLLVDRLAELRDWLLDPEQSEHADELVLLYLENVLDGDAAAHAAAVAAIEATLGGLVHRPTAGDGCQDLPVHLSESEILASGARVLITGNCGPGGWNDVVFQRGPAWDESGSSTDYLAGSDCDTERAANDYDNRFIRRWEDSTFLSLMVNGGSHISPAVAAAMARCGVNLPGLDQLHPADDRMPAFVWSWREDQPSDVAAAGCAAQGADARFTALDCAQRLPVACRTADGGWAVTTDPVAWADGDQACAADGHGSAGVPANGWDNQLLRRAVDAGPGGDVWLAYGRTEDGRWVTDIPAPVVEPEPEPGVDRGRRPDHAGPPAAPRAAPVPAAGSAAGPVAPVTERAASRVLPGIGVALVLAAVAFGVLRPRRRRQGTAAADADPAPPVSSGTS
jgi:hypothetical protein